MVADWAEWVLCASEASRRRRLRPLATDSVCEEGVAEAAASWLALQQGRQQPELDNQEGCNQAGPTERDVCAAAAEAWRAD